MRINSKEILFGQPILRIREVVRHAMAEKLCMQDESMIIEEVSNILKQSAFVASYVISQLIEEGYLVLNKVKYVNVFQYQLTETDKGRRFGVATANPPITRQKANLLLKELIARAEAINMDAELVYMVERIRVFGSYLSNKEVLGDLDVAVKLGRKVDGDDFTEMNQKRISTALMNGRSFSSFFEEMSWPYKEVMLMLKTKKKGLSLHDEDSDEVITKTKSKLVYEFNPGK